MTKQNQKNIIEKIPFNKVVIWGLRKKYHTHRYIHSAFYKALQRNNVPSIWVDDSPENTKYIEPNDLILSSEVIGKMVPEKRQLSDYNLPIRDDVFYCLHNHKNIFTEKIKKDKLVRLQVYTNEAENSDQKWGPVTFFDTKSRTLYQPWGTDIPAENFSKPTFNTHSFVFWIGSIWNNSLNQGNINAINEFKNVLRSNLLHFIPLRFIPGWLNTFLIRQSRLAPAIASDFQVEKNYLPCRMFKNISYGQLGFSNVNGFKKILGENVVPGNTIKEITNNALKLSKTEYLTLVSKQQEIIKKYTYEAAWNNIFRAFK